MTPSAESRRSRYWLLGLLLFAALLAGATVHFALTRPENRAPASELP